MRAPVPALRLLGFAVRVAPLPLYPDQLAWLQADKRRLAEGRPDVRIAPRPLREASKHSEREPVRGYP